MKPKSIDGIKVNKAAQRILDDAGRIIEFKGKAITRVALSKRQWEQLRDALVNAAKKQRLPKPEVLSFQEATSYSYQGAVLYVVNL